MNYFSMIFDSFLLPSLYKGVITALFHPRGILFVSIVKFIMCEIVLDDMLVVIFKNRIGIPSLLTNVTCLNSASFEFKSARKK